MKSFWVIILIFFIVGLWTFASIINTQNKYIDKQGNEIIIHEGDGYKFCFFERKVEILTEDNINIKEESETEFVHRVEIFVKENPVYDLTFTRTKAVMTFEIYVITKRYMDVDWIFDSKGKLIRAFVRGWTTTKRLPKEVKKRLLK